MEFNKIRELDSKNYFTVLSRQNVCFVRGDGCYLYDTQGKEYLDFMGGLSVNCLGYNDPDILKAIVEQSSKLIHISNAFYNEPQAILCENLLQGGVFSRMGLTNGGAEANEMAIQLVKRHFYNRREKRHKIITALNSFHGNTLATLSASGMEKYSRRYAPLPDGFEHVPFNDFNALKNALDNDTAAVFLECIQGENGVVLADYDYLVNAYALCKSKGALFVLDEVQTGMGRTGTMFGFEHYGILPDIITLAKGLGAGIPIGACLARGEVAGAFKAGDYGTTFGGNPLACAVANVVVDKLKNTSLLSTVTDAGFYLNTRLSKLKKHNFVADVRGIGLLQALQLTDRLKAVEVAGRMLQKGFIINSVGNNTLRFAPPYTVSFSQIDSMCDALSELFASTNI